jgi:hypothetical protein
MANMQRKQISLIRLYKLASAYILATAKKEKWTNAVAMTQNERIADYIRYVSAHKDDNL